MCAYFHQPVLLNEVLAALRPGTAGCYADGTVGGAGHAAAILRASSPGGRLYGCDRDGTAVAAATVALAEFSGRFELRQGSYAELAGWIPAGSCDGVLLDLGVSSPQLDDPARGFSLKADGPLDMRFDVRSARTAAEIVNGADESELAGVFWRYGDERHSRRLARALVAARGSRPFRTTGQLAEFVAARLPRGNGRVHPATKVFQALRMAVNDEPGQLVAGLEAAWRILKVGGRLAVITFHSGEDRRVKQFGRVLEKDYDVPGEVDVPELRRPRPARLRWLERRAIQPGDAEVVANPRARSAQLRVMEKLMD